jgi:hypothetical protein
MRQPPNCRHPPDSSHTATRTQPSRRPAKTVGAGPIPSHLHWCKTAELPFRNGSRVVSVQQDCMGPYRRENSVVADSALHPGFMPCADKSEECYIVGTFKGVSALILHCDRLISEGHQICLALRGNMAPRWAAVHVPTRHSLPHLRG